MRAARALSIIPAVLTAALLAAGCGGSPLRQLVAADSTATATIVGDVSGAPAETITPRMFTGAVADAPGPGGARPAIVLKGHAIAGTAAGAEALEWPAPVTFAAGIPPRVGPSGRWEINGTQDLATIAREIVRRHGDLTFVLGDVTFEGARGTTGAEETPENADNVNGVFAAMILRAPDVAEGAGERVFRVSPDERGRTNEVIVARAVLLARGSSAGIDSPDLVAEDATAVIELAPQSRISSGELLVWKVVDWDAR